MPVPKKLAEMFARYQIPYSYIQESYGDGARLDCSLTIDDVHEALGKGIKEDLNTFLFEWFMPVNQMLSEHRIDDSQVIDENGYEEDGFPNPYNMFDFIWTGLQSFFAESVPYDMHDLYHELDVFMKNRDKGPMEKELTDFQKQQYISWWENRYYQADDTAKILYRSYLDDLCDEDNIFGLKTKAYAFYGNGNGYYQQDWYKAELYLLKWYDLSADPQAANTLGYMYYYGRTTQGDPDYDRAYYYFSIGHAGGYMESTYKLADLFEGGLGVAKDEHTAFDLVSQCYRELAVAFRLKQYDCEFADAALRMGSYYKYGIGCEQNPHLAYFFLLQADYAIRKRMETVIAYGDDRVAKRIRKEMEGLVPQDLKPLKTAHFPSVGSLLAGNFHISRRFEMKIKRLKSGNISLTFRIIPRGQEEEDILLTVPEADLCTHVKSVTVTLKDIERFETAYNSDYIIFDDIESNILFEYGQPVAIAEGDFVLKITDRMLEDH